MKSGLINKKRIAIFAHYDKDNIIDDYVVFYLNSLKEVAQKIIFVSDCNLSEDEKRKLTGITEIIITEPHGEYDFGSYKRGFLYAKDNGFLQYFDELILANDSCYGPFYPLKNVFEEMDKKNCDFWGITENKYGIRKSGKIFFRDKQPHLQSYFLTFKKNIFQSDLFIDFISSVKKQECKADIIFYYESGLCKLLSDENFKKAVYTISAQSNFNPVICDWDKLILKNKMPFLKCSVPRLENMEFTSADEYKKIIRKISDYPVYLIENNIKRTSLQKDFLFFLPAKIRIFTYKFIFFFKKFNNLIKKNCIPE